MGHRLDRYGIGKLVTMRDHNPQDIAKIVHQLMNLEMLPVELDKGIEVANIILNSSR
jgi:hypothetical protein